MTATLHSPLPHRLAAWAGERWPAANAVGVLVLYVAAVLFQQALAGGDPTLTARDLAGFAGALAYSLLIRVLDEHKDYEIDLANHPDRVLQSGRVALRHLRAVGAVAFAITLAVSLLMGVMTWWAVLMVWTALMAKDFFAEGLHRRWRLVAAVTHGLALPLTISWIAAMSAAGDALPAGIGLLGAFVLLLMLAVDIGRKLKAPEDERPTLDSHTRTLGTRGAATLLAGFALASPFVAWALLVDAGVDSALAGAALLASVVPALVGAARFARRPTREQAAKTEALVRLTALAALLVAIVAVWA